MAREIIIQTSMLVRNGAYQYQFTPSQMQIDQSEVGGGSPGFLEVGADPEQVLFSDIAVPGWAVFQNLDTLHYIDVGPDHDGGTGPVFVPAWRLMPGEYVIVRLIPGVDYWVQAPEATTEPVKLLAVVFNN